MVKEKFWMSPPPLVCDLCHKPMKTGFADARVPRLRTWGSVCLYCFKQENCRTGAGLGQVYERRASGRWVKILG